MHWITINLKTIANFDFQLHSQTVAGGEGVSYKQVVSGEYLATSIAFQITCKSVCSHKDTMFYNGCACASYFSATLGSSTITWELGPKRMVAHRSIRASTSVSWMSVELKIHTELTFIMSLQMLIASTVSILTSFNKMPRLCLTRQGSRGDLFKPRVQGAEVDCRRILLDGERSVIQRRRLGLYNRASQVCTGRDDRNEFY